VQISPIHQCKNPEIRLIGHGFCRAGDPLPVGTTSINIRKNQPFWPYVILLTYVINSAKNYDN
jgi:hypothetical protein